MRASKNRKFFVNIIWIYIYTHTHTLISDYLPLALSLEGPHEDFEIDELQLAGFSVNHMQL